MIKYTVIFGLIFLVSCSSTQPKIKPVDNVELEKFMGDWYVLAHIPAFVEKNAYNAIESYQYNKEKELIQTTFTFNSGDFNGPPKKYEPLGYVLPGTNNAVWGMQFIWPIKAQYIISYVDNDYQNTIVARDKRDYLWFMSRNKEISTKKKQWIYEKTTELGYDKDMIRFVPHK